MQKTIKIISCSIKKEGKNEKTGKDWTLYIVKCSGDDEMTEFSTFSRDYVNSEGQQMNSNFEFNQQYKNWQEVSQTKAAESSKHDEIMGALRNIYEIIDRIEVKVDSLVNGDEIPEDSGDTYPGSE